MNIIDFLTLIEQAKIIVALATLVVTGGVATSIVTELLKWKAFLAPAKRWPKTVAALMSIGSSVAVITLSGNLRLDNLATIIVFAIAVFLASTQLYDKVLWKVYEKIK